MSRRGQFYGHRVVTILRDNLQPLKLVSLETFVYQLRHCRKERTTGEKLSSRDLNYDDTDLLRELRTFYVSCSKRRTKHATMHKKRLAVEDWPADLFDRTKEIPRVGWSINFSHIGYRRKILRFRSLHERQRRLNSEREKRSYAECEAKKLALSKSSVLIAPYFFLICMHRILSDTKIVWLMKKLAQPFPHSVNIPRSNSSLSAKKSSVHQVL